MIDAAKSPDVALVARARAGDFSAFDALVERHERGLYALAMQLLQSRADAEDVVQESFLAAMERLEGFRGEAAFGTWVRRIARNKALNILRRRRTWRQEPAEEFHEAQLERPELIAQWRADVERSMDRAEMARVLEAGIAQLTAGQRAAFVLRDLEGLSTAEAAEALQISEGALKVRLLRARLALREHLTRTFGDACTRISHAAHGAKTRAEVSP